MDKTLLVTNGCSWVYGDKLKKPEEQNFTKLLGNSMFKQTCNLAVKKGSNSRISRTTIHWLLENKDRWDDIFMLIGWTGAVDRPEFYSPFQKQWIPINNWNIKGDEYIKTEEERQDRDMAEAYYSLHWSELASFWDYYSNVLLLQNFLKSNNIDYYFFRSFAFEDPYTRQHYGYNSVVQAGLDVLKGLNPLVTNSEVQARTPMTKHQYSDEDIWNTHIRQEGIPKNWADVIDLELFPSFINYNKTFQYHIQDNKRSDGLTFREIYPTHPNKDEHRIWAKQLQKEIEEL